MTYTLTFLLACTLIGAFTALGVVNMESDSRLGYLSLTAAVFAAVGAAGSWEKRREEG